jgi:hypothetical protein
MLSFLLGAALLSGQWQYYKTLYNGEEMPPRDPRLQLIFEFKDNGEDRLYWTYDEGQTFCERRGKYEFSENILKDEVVWVNPDNAPECGADPDMQQGRTTSSPASIVDNELQIEIPLGSESIIYVWKRIE